MPLPFRAAVSDDRRPLATLSRRVQGAKKAVGRSLRRLGFEPSRITQGSGFDPETAHTIRRVERFTMTSRERIAAVCDAARYVDSRRIPGAIVECGVWRGGAMMAAALTLIARGDTSRDLFLYDTFAGMTDPTDVDRDQRGRPAGPLNRLVGRDRLGSAWCYAPLDEVIRNVHSTEYPEARTHFVKGPVEETIPATLPGPIAVLRLDTDWYESTAHELEHLMPLLQPGGVLLVDDYGHWQGARKAVDEYLERSGLQLLLARTDYSGRLAVMPGLPLPGQD